MSAPASGRTAGSSRPLVVTHVLYSFQIGGSELYAWRVAANLDAERFRSVMCAMDLGGPLEAEFDERGVAHEVIGAPPGFHLTTSRRLYRLFRSHRADVVHTHHFRQLLHCAVPARMCGARLIHTEHDTSLLGNRRVARALSVLGRMCTVVTVVGDLVGEQLAQRTAIPPQRIRVVPAGVDVAAFANQMACPEQNTATADHGGPRVLVVARLSPEKNHAGLLRAFARVVVAQPHATLVIAGEGPVQASIRQQIDDLRLRDSVRMLGARRDVPALMASCDVVTLFSDREGLPLVILEAMAAGKPVVATAVGDVPKVVRDGDTGLLVQPQAEKELAEALLRVMGDPALARNLGASGRQLVRQQYDLRSTVGTYQRIYSTRRSAKGRARGCFPA